MAKTTPTPIARPESASGFYLVEISRLFPFGGFDYKPGQAITVNERILDAMEAEEGLVTRVAAA